MKIAAIRLFYTKWIHCLLGMFLVLADIKYQSNIYLSYSPNDSQLERIKRNNDHRDCILIGSFRGGID